MPVNMFDSPLAGQYMNTYTRLPFKEIAAMGDQLRKTSEEAAADAEGLAAMLNVPAIEKDRMRRKELTGQLEDEVSSIYDIYKSDPYRAKEQARRLGVKINKTLNQGELGAIKARYDQQQGIIKDIKERYKDDPRIANYYMGQISAEDLNYDASAGTYGSVLSPTQDRIYTAEELGSHYNVILDNISSDQYLKSGAPKELASVPFSQLLEMPGATEYINFDKVKNALIGATTPEIQQSAEVQGRAMGLGEGQGNFVNEDGTFNTETSLGRMLQGMAGGKAFTKDKRGSVQTLTDKLGMSLAKTKEENRYVVSNQGNVVTRGAIKDADGNPIVNSSGALKKIASYDADINKLTAEMAAISPTNTALKKQYQDQIDVLQRQRTQAAAVLNDAIGAAAKKKGWTRQVHGKGTTGEYVQWYDAEGKEVDIYPNYMIGDTRVNEILAGDVDAEIEKRMAGRDIQVNNYHGTGDLKLDKYYSAKLYDFAATSTMTDDAGNQFTLDQITANMTDAEKKRFKEGKVGVKFTETPDSQYGTYGMSFTVETDGVNKTFYMAAPPEYGQSKITNSDGSTNSVRVAMNQASLDWSEASKLPDGGTGVPSKAGFGTYYFDNYKGQTLTGANFIFVPAKGVKVDMDGDGVFEIADGKTAISVDKDKAAMTKLFMLNQQGVDYNAQAAKEAKQEAQAQEQAAQKAKQQADDMAKSKQTYQPFNSSSADYSGDYSTTNASDEEYRDDEADHAFNQLTTSEKEELSNMLIDRSGGTVVRTPLAEELGKLETSDPEEHHRRYMKIIKDIIAKRKTAQ